MEKKSNVLVFFMNLSRWIALITFFFSSLQAIAQLWIKRKTTISRHIHFQPNILFEKRPVNVWQEYFVSPYITRYACLPYSGQSGWANNFIISSWCLYTTELNYWHISSISGKFHQYHSVRFLSCSKYDSVRPMFISFILVIDFRIVKTRE